MSETVAKELLQTFENPAPRRNYHIRHTAPEFTSVCPKTGQPDFGVVEIEYIAEQTCVELKSLKLYLQSFRDRGIYYEAVTNQILDDLVDVLAPRWCRVETRWNPRGGMTSVIVAEHRSSALQVEQALAGRQERGSHP